jgi:molybdopterin-containing oxidoreductase family iron-sulfur binding subunit
LKASGFPLKNLDAQRVHKANQASKCTMCHHLVKQGQDPRCVQSCPSRALIFGDLDDPGSEVHKKMKMALPLRASAGTRPKVGYIMPASLEKQVEKRVEENPFMMR